MLRDLRHCFRYLAKWFITLALVVFIFSQPYPSSGSEAKPVKAPDFSLKDLQGHTIKLSQFKGKVVLVNFWATWCSPCRAEIPDLIAIHEKYKGKGFTVIGISLDGAATLAAKNILEEFIKKAAVTYPVLLGDNAVSNDYGGIYAIPASFLIDSRGDIAKKYTGIVRMDTLEKDLLPLLKNKGNGKSK